jgi:hypothetical protein
MMAWTMRKHQHEVDATLGVGMVRVGEWVVWGYER